jgi:hypothetical protein
VTARTDDNITEGYTTKLQIELTGECPLLMHSSALADPCSAVSKQLAGLTRKRDKTVADHEAIARIEWGGGLWLADGRPCIPAEAIEGALVDAAETRRRGKIAAAGFICNGPALLEYEGPTSPEELWWDERFRLRTSAKVNRGSRTMRTRPRFPEWKVTFEAECVPGLIEEDEVVELFKIAGLRIGIGDWRPKYGRFSVKRLN